MRSVLLLQHHQSRYGVIPSMIEHLKEGLKQIGVEAHISDCSSYEQVIFDIEQYEPDCTWSINISVDKEFFYLPYGIPHVQLILDIAETSLSKDKSHLVLLCIDKTSANLFGFKKSALTYWFPHAISCDDLDAFRSRPFISLDQRSYDIVLLGSCLDYEKEKSMWKSLFSTSIVQSLDQMAERALEDPSFLLYVDVLASIESTPSILSILQTHNLDVWDLINSIERYMRGLDRERLLHSFPGRTTHLFSCEQDIPNWVHNCPNVILHKEIPFSDVADLCSQTRIVLNSIPMIRNGFHERLFLGLASGAVMVTTKLPLLPSWLEDSGALVSYTTSSMATLSKRVYEAEKKERNQEEIFQWLECEHTWKARLQKLFPEIDKNVQDLRMQWKDLYQ